MSGVCIRDNFPDPDGLLETAFTDFHEFLRVYGFGEGDYEIVFEEKQQSCYEAYTIDISKTRCVVLAGDTEGIRRAVVFLEDEMLRREGCFLPVGTITRAPFIKTRISRCFFSPHYNPNSEGELADEIEYYPTEYLNRLAHEGVNGLWIQERFFNLLPSDIVPEYGASSERRIKKLNRVIKRCARYGIRVYILGVEPASTYDNPLLTNHPDMLGHTFVRGLRTVCPSTEKGRAYIEESIKRLFTLAPDLAGFINISVGEAVASCGADETDPGLNCPHCLNAGLTKSGAITLCEHMMRRALDAVKPEAEIISWTYALRTFHDKNVSDYLENRDIRVPHLQNFEDLGEPVQLGKPRLAYDYWLAYAGPGKLFEKSAEAARRRGSSMYAKIQVCNSHEVASVPYVQVQGILYD